MTSKWSVQQTVALLRQAGVPLQQIKGPRRVQRAGMHVTRWLGDPYRGQTAVIIGTTAARPWDEQQARIWFGQAIDALAQAGAQIVFPNEDGGKSMSLVVL